MPSTTGAGVHVVNLKTGECSCPDRTPKDETDKHVVAARYVKTKTATCSGCGARFRHRDLLEVGEDKTSCTTPESSCAVPAGSGTASCEGDLGGDGLRRPLIRTALPAPRLIAYVYISEGTTTSFRAHGIVHVNMKTYREETMELYTSHWRNQDLAGLDMVPVGISRGVPRGKRASQLPYRYKRVTDLAPPSELFARWKAGAVDPEEYTRVYRSHLDSLGLEEVTGQLERKSAGNGEKPLVLLCWCSPGEFCHRRVWADWYREKTGQEIPELGETKAA